MKVLGQYVVAQGSDRFYGWPANCGMWCWQTEESPKGEILVGFTEGYHLVDHGTHHAIDCDRPSALVFGRSYDGGETWTDGVNTDIPNPSSRVCLLRLKSGRVLLVNNMDSKERVAMTALLSDDDGKTFTHSMLLDNCRNVSYKNE